MISRAYLHMIATALFAASVIAVPLTLGCVGTESGNPPIANEEKIIVEVSDALETVRAIGLEGAMEGADEVQYVGIGSGSRFLKFPVNEDGSFEFETPFDSSVARLQALNSAGRSDVVDRDLGEGVLSGCSIAPTPTFLDLRVGNTITVTDACGAADETFQFGDAGFSLVGRRAADGLVEYDIAHDGRRGESEDLFLITTEGGVIAASLYACPECDPPVGAAMMPLAAEPADPATE